VGYEVYDPPNRFYLKIYISDAIALSDGNNIETDFSATFILRVGRGDTEGCGRGVKTVKSPCHNHLSGWREYCTRPTVLDIVHNPLYISATYTHKKWKLNMYEQVYMHCLGISFQRNK
jgi:hypothetical protein